jgi:hypothetical protein
MAGPLEHKDMPITDKKKKKKKKKKPKVMGRAVCLEILVIKVVL